MTQVTITGDPYVDSYRESLWPHRGIWPCKWIGPEQAVKTPTAIAYRKKFTMAGAKTVRIHVTADERYELFLDGNLLGRGSERGDRENWFFETYDLSLSAGEHVLAAKVWALGDLAPYAQFSVRPGFLLSPEGEFIEMLGTGVAPWDYTLIEGLEFYREGMVWGTGADLIVHGDKFPWGFEKGQGNPWRSAVVTGEARDAKYSNEVAPTQRLRPGTLPARLDREVSHAKVRFVGKVDSFDLKSVAICSQDHLSDEAKSWNLIGTAQTVTIPPKTGRRVILDLENYYCAYPIVRTQGGQGSQVRLYWAEALFIKPGEYEPKGNRNEIDGKFFVGAGDTFFPDGGERTFPTLWWQAGRYLELVVQTAEEPLTLGLGLRETRYPLEMESSFEADDKRLNDVIPVALRGLQMCSHETYMDCPYYEQLMYVGDTRLEALTTYMITHDDRLPRKALDLFRASLIHSGLTQSRYPSRVRQVIPPFSLLWVGMVYDYALWRGDREFVYGLMPGVRGVIDAFLAFRNADGLVQGPDGWNFMDWVPTWSAGIPPEGDFGVSGVINWLMVYTLKRAAELEEWLGELELAQRDNRLAEDLAMRLMKHFWDEKKGLFADDPAHTFFSEHSQCLAILSGVLNDTMSRRVGQGLLSTPDLAKTTIYFSHYLFETYQQLGVIDALFDRLNLWFELERHGFKTTFESPEPSRSDCHAWGAHPIFHYYSSILGIRPTEMGFDTIIIKPQLGPLQKVKASLVHPRGTIDVDFQQKDGHVSGTVILPEGVSGVFVQKGRATSIKGGRQSIE